MLKERGIYMDFSEALKAAKEGSKISRAGWNGKNMWVMAQYPDAHSKMSAPYLYIKTAGDKLFPWTVSQEDLFGEDWGVV